MPGGVGGQAGDAREAPATLAAEPVASAHRRHRSRTGRGRPRPSPSRHVTPLRLASPSPSPAPPHDPHDALSAPNPLPSRTPSMANLAMDGFDSEGSITATANYLRAVSLAIAFYEYAANPFPPLPSPRPSAHHTSSVGFLPSPPNTASTRASARGASAPAASSSSPSGPHSFASSRPPRIAPS